MLFFVILIVGDFDNDLFWFVYTQLYYIIVYKRTIKGGIAMTVEKLKSFLSKNNGQITRKDAENLNIYPTVLSRLVKSGQLERVERGVYIDPNIFEDDMFVLQYKYSKGIYFKDTSLFLHGMIDRTPDKYDMNFPSQYSNSDLKKYPIRMHRQIDSLYTMGIEEIQSPGNHLIKTYNIERTLCDIVRGRDKSDMETIKQAMNSYIDRPDKNLGQLFDYAKKLKVEKIIGTYMEILL